MNPDAVLTEATYNDKGLVTAIAQDYETGEVLMLAYMNEDTLRQTLETGVMTYWSRSRQKVWVKGETSGNTQQVEEVHIDCDGDALLFQVQQSGAACHTGYYSCFYRRLDDGALVEEGERVFDPEDVYGS
jgi:phosphoribosyl-AMP cyclohydrolase